MDCASHMDCSDGLQQGASHWQSCEDLPAGERGDSSSFTASAVQQLERATSGGGIISMVWAGASSVGASGADHARGYGRAKGGGQGPARRRLLADCSQEYFDCSLSPSPRTNSRNKLANTKGKPTWAPQHFPLGKTLRKQGSLLNNVSPPRRVAPTACTATSFSPSQAYIDEAPALPISSSSQMSRCVSNSLFDRPLCPYTTGVWSSSEEVAFLSRSSPTSGLLVASPAVTVSAVEEPSPSRSSLGRGSLAAAGSAATGVSASSSSVGASYSSFFGACGSPSSSLKSNGFHLPPSSLMPNYSVLIDGTTSEIALRMLESRAPPATPPYLQPDTVAKRKMDPNLAKGIFAKSSSVPSLRGAGRKTLHHETRDKLRTSLYDLRRAGRQRGSEKMPKGKGRDRSPDETGGEDALDRFNSDHPGVALSFDAGEETREAPEDRENVRGREGSPGPSSKEDTTLMMLTLGDCTDSARSLAERVDVLQQAEDIVAQNGGGQHASSCISRRTLEVVLRKLELLKTLETQTAHYEGFLAKKSQLLSDIFGGQLASDLGKPVAGFRKFVARHVHDGNPQEADKSDFRRFCSSFLLPSQHQVVLRARRALQHAVDHLTQAALDRVNAELLKADEAAMLRLSSDISEVINLMFELSVPAKHDCIQLLRDRSQTVRVRYVVWAAEEEEKKDEMITGEGSDGTGAYNAAWRIKDALKESSAFGIAEGTKELLKAKDIASKLRGLSVLRNARKARDSEASRPSVAATPNSIQIREECKEAVQFGVLPTSDALQESRSIANDLRGGAAIRFAQSEKERDEAANEAAGGYIEDSASKTADAIEKEIKSAEDSGVPKGHEKLNEAQKVANSVRDEEFLRKRRKAAKKRQSQ